MGYVMGYGLSEAWMTKTKRRRFGAIKRITRGGRDWLEASYQTPLDAFTTWPNLPKRQYKVVAPEYAAELDAWLADAEKRISFGEWTPPQVERAKRERDGELAALRVGDVHYRTRRIHITRTVTPLRHGHGEGTPKNGKSRKVPIPRFLMGDLHALTDGRDPDEYLFANSKGGRIGISSWSQKIWHPALAAAGIKEGPNRRITVHALRHSYASMAIASGCDPKTLQTVLGHSSAKVTLDVYAELWPDRMDQVTDAIVEKFLP